MRTLIALLLATALIAGCSAGDDESRESLEADLASLERTNSLLEQRVAELEELIEAGAEVAKSVDALEDWAIGFQSKQLKRQRQQARALKEVRDNIDALEEEIGQASDDSASVSRLAKDLNAIRDDLDGIAAIADLALEEAEAALAAAGTTTAPAP
jgi:hypothetical protein